MWCKGDLEDKANFLFNLVKHPPKRDAEGRPHDPSKHPNEFFRIDAQEANDLEKCSSSDSCHGHLAKPPTPRGFFANLFGRFSHTPLIEELEITEINPGTPHSEGPKTLGIQHSENDEIIWTNKNLRYVFRRLFEFSIEFPENSFFDFEDLEMVDIADYRTNSAMRGPLGQLKM